MKKIEKKVEVIELDLQETKLLIEIINYAYHRAEKHDTPMTKFADEIKKMRKDLKII